MYDEVVSFLLVLFGENIDEGLVMGGDWFFILYIVSDKCKLEVREKKEFLININGSSCVWLVMY